MNKNKIKKNERISDDTQIGLKYIKITLILILIFILFYLVTYFVKNKNTTTSTDTSIQYSKILASNILNASDTSYYVLVKYEDDKYNSLYEAYLGNLNENDVTTTYYVVDLTSGFNKKYISQDENLKVSDASEFKFNKSALLKIEGGKVTRSLSGKDNILNFLKTDTK